VDMMDTGHVFKRILKRGSMGDDVLKLQKQLNQKGYGILDEDGIFGPCTEDSARRFQIDHIDPKGRRLDIDGIVGPLTWWALFNGNSGSTPHPNPPRSESSELMPVSLKAARGELRRNVREIPSGSNRGPDVEKYLASVGRNPGDAWCAAFVYWCVEKASNSLGTMSHLMKTGRVASMWHDAVERNSVITVEDVRAGIADIPHGAIYCAVYTSGKGHTGFVERREGDILHTIEGNTSIKGSSSGEGVRAKKRSLSRYKAIKGFIIY
jgi:hypothetical protein